MVYQSLYRSIHNIGTHNNIYKEMWTHEKNLNFLSL